MFQPIFSARTGKVMAYEALMRSDMEALRSPATIMKLAREQGALCEIERLTFFKSLENFDHLRSEGLVRRDTMLFINSIASVCLPREDSEYMESRWHELCRQMVIEITEEEEINHEALEAKRHVPGFSGMFALDDYGSGFANENSLLELSPRFIKVDIAIIRGIDTDPDKQQIVQNIVAYAHPRNMKIIAGGVETAAELRKVIELGADALQGYFLAKPAAVPAKMAPAARKVLPCKTCRRAGQNGTCRPQGHCRVQLCIRQRLNTNIKSPAEMRGFLHLPLAYCSLLRYTGTGQTTAQEVLFYYGTGRPYHRLFGRRQNHLSAPVCPVSGGTGPQCLHSGKRLRRSERGCHAGAGPSWPELRP